MIHGVQKEGQGEKQVSDLPLAPGRGLGQPHYPKEQAPVEPARGETAPLWPSLRLYDLPLWAEETVPAAVPTTALFGQGSLVLWRPLTACGGGLLTIPMQATHEALSQHNLHNTS